MAYTHVQRDVQAAVAQLTSAAAIIGRLSAGYQPFMLRAVALVFTTAPTGTGVLTVRLRPAAGTTAGQSTIGIINFTAALGVAGNVIFLDDLNTKVAPGAEVSFEITTTAATGVVDVHAFIEESWENPANNTRMKETT